MTYIGAPPASFVIPVTLGADREFTLRRKDSDGNPVDWDADLWISIDINRSNPTIVNADVAADQAVIRLESTICDQTKTGMAWRVIMSIPGSPQSLETAVAVGTFERNDGR